MDLKMKNESIILIDEVYQDFSEKIANLNDFLHTVKKNTENIALDIDKKRQRIEDVVPQTEHDKYVKDIIGKTFRSHLFYNPYTEEPNSYGHSEIDVYKEMELCLSLKNKQYQWLLTEAYELFEDYIESIYACAGLIDNDFWPASDYGSISVSEIKSKDFSWFQTTASKKKEATKAVLHKLRTEIDNFAKAEATNPLKRNYRFFITMIENLRHIIVHNGGYFNDVELFIKNTIQKSGINGKKAQDFEDKIKYFIGKIHEKDAVLLLEVPSTKYPPHMNAHVSKINFLIEVLMEYSFIIMTELKNHFSISITNN